MTLKIGDVVTIDGVELEVTNVGMDAYWFKERDGGTNYYSLVFHTTEALEKMMKQGRFSYGRSDKITPGSTECRYHNWNKYVGAVEVYEFCVWCDAKRTRDWRQIRDDKEY